MFNVSIVQEWQKSALYKKSLELQQNPPAAQDTHKTSEFAGGSIDEDKR